MPLSGNREREVEQHDALAGQMMSPGLRPSPPSPRLPLRIISSRSSKHPSAIEMAEPSWVQPQEWSVNPSRGDLLGIVRDDRIPDRTRREALQWVGIEASRTLDAEAERSEPRDEDREVRERAVFAMSQLPRDQAVPRLLSVASAHRFVHVRQKALFWLGQTGDPRAIELFEEMLRAAPSRD